MKLSNYFNSDELYRDAEFYALGLSNSDPKKPFLTYLDDIKYLDEIQNNSFVSAIICRPDYIDCFVEQIHLGIVVCENPRKRYFEFHNMLSQSYKYSPNMDNNKFGNNCSISNLASISPFGIVLGNNVVIEDFVRINGPCRIGDNTVIHSGAIIGGEGFEFKRYEESVLDVQHCGEVVIGHNTIIWENVTVHKAVYPWDSTYIGDWVRVGAQSHIDHGAKIMNYVEICARCTISGRTHIGEHAFIGPGSIISNRISVGMNTKVLLGSVVTVDVQDGKIVSGNFAIEHDKHINRVLVDSEAVLR